MGDQLASREFSEGEQRWLKSFGLKFAVEDDQVQVRGHDDEGIHREEFFFMAIAQALADDLASGFADENGQPFDDAERAEIHR